jgi:hypothetical protein
MTFGTRPRHPTPPYEPRAVENSLSICPETISKRVPLMSVVARAQYARSRSGLATLIAKPTLSRSNDWQRKVGRTPARSDLGILRSVCVSEFHAAQPAGHSDVTEHYSHAMALQQIQSLVPRLTLQVLHIRTTQLLRETHSHKHLILNKGGSWR